MKSRSCLAHLSWLAALAVLILLLTGCEAAQSQGPHSSAPSGSDASTTGITIHGDPDRLLHNTPERMCPMPLVVDGVISSLGKSHWNTPDGTLPSTVDANTVITKGYIMYTPIFFASMHIYIDHRSVPTSEFVTVGGTVGPDQYSMDFPQVTPHGRYVLVFGIASDRQGQSPSGKMLGVEDAFPISTAGIVTLQPGSTEQGTVSPGVTMPLSQLSQQLANCKPA